MSRTWSADRGFLTFAFNTAHVDYLDLAYRLGQSIGQTQKIKSVSVVLDDITAKSLSDQHRQTFDRIIIYNSDREKTKDFSHESMAWQLTPYKQTIKIEADMLMTSSVDHWWSILDERDICLTTSVFDNQETLITNRSQRKLFDDNLLPNVYTALYYFRYTQNSQKFFKLVQQIYEHWPWFRDHYLINCRYETPVTDEVFAIAAKLFGEHLCTLPMDLPTFVHMKNSLLDLPNDSAWWEYLYREMGENGVKLGHYKQRLPLHYHRKDFWRD
jgi:hypothetical protein